MGGPFNAVTVESEAITEITMSGPGAGGRQTASAVLGDVVSAITKRAAPPPPPEPLEVVERRRERLLLAHGGHRRAGRARRDRRGCSAQQGASIKSVVQRGLGENARLVMVTHPISEARLREASGLIAELEFVGSAPRVIRVIEEEFV